MIPWFHARLVPRVLASRSWGGTQRLAVLAALACWGISQSAIPAYAGDRLANEFRDRVQPILEDHCYGCHGGGSKKGGVSLDAIESDQSRLQDHDLWWAVLKNVRAGLMPPADKPRPSDKELRLLEDWIKFGAFGLDPQHPDPGRVTVRRLNRVEYRNTIRALLGVEYDTSSEFPPDDTGHGFDNIGDVLTISPLLLEKYVSAAKSIVAQAVPTTSGVVAEKVIAGRKFHPADKPASTDDEKGPLPLSYYEAASVSNTYEAQQAGHYELVADLTANEKYVDGMFDYNKCRFRFKADGEIVYEKEFGRQDGKPFQVKVERDWQTGAHELAFELQPLTPDEKQVRSLAIRIHAVTVRGPFAKEHYTRPPNYERYFPRDVPEGARERRDYAREILGRFATKAFRRPIDPATVDRLAALAEHVYTQDGQTFESGVAQAMTAILASPRFLFREEGTEAGDSEQHPYVDEYALASRLSYFLWSSTPDDELFRLASEHKLRANLAAQVSRMLADPRSNEFFRHFVGQWLQARDIETVLINAFAVVSRDEIPDPEAERRRARFRELNRKPPEKLTEDEKKELNEVRATFFKGFRRFREFELTGELRQAMRRETEMLFEHIVRSDRSLLEVLDCNYTFLNERLAKHYGINEVKGPEMRYVELPPESPRGGILTQGTVLAVTSNPDRTSPVKRGLFILENILGTPPAPPPPNIPPLDDAKKAFKDRTPSLRETLELHRSQALCSSCHSRMDPLGLALENFNALGRYRIKERENEIDPEGMLITGEPFASVHQLKHILVTARRRDFYRCLSEKMLTYALGRGLDYHDVQSVDALVDRIEKQNGSASALLMGIVESTPFQRRRRLTSDKALSEAPRASRENNNKGN
jgi:hypothetical protein